MWEFSVADVLTLTDKLYTSVTDEYTHRIINKPKYKQQKVVEIINLIREDPNILDHHRLAKYMVDKDLWPMCGMEKEKDNTELRKHLTYI